MNDALLVASVRQNQLMEQASSRAKDTFLAVLSHELRTPFAPVVMTLFALEIDRDMPFKFRDDLAMGRRYIDLEVKLIDWAYRNGFSVGK